MLKQIKSYFSRPMEEDLYDTILNLIGHIFFLALIVLSAVFYQERMFNFDTAYYAFNILYNEDFIIAHERTISYPSQLLPLLVVKLGGSLKTFLLVYSVSFMLVYYMVYNIIVYLMKNPRAGIFFALAVCLTVRYKFFASIAEITSSIALVALLVGWMSKDLEKFPRLKPWQNWLIALGIVLLFFTAHPVIAVPVFTFLAFDVVYHKKWMDWGNWLLIATAVGVFFVRFTSISEGSYEGDKLSILQNAREVLSHVEDYKAWHMIKWYFETQYTFAFVLFLVAIFLLVIKKHWLSSLLLLVATAAYLVLNLVTYSYIRGTIYNMIDGYLGLLGVIWSIAILYGIIRSEYRRASITIVTFLLIFSTVRITEKAEFFRNRIEYLTGIMNMYGIEDKRKLFIHMKDYSWDHLWYPWSIPYETLLMSAEENPEQAKTIYFVEYGQDITKLKGKRNFIGMFNYPVRKLPERYFSLPENDYFYIDNLAIKPDFRAE